MIFIALIFTIAIPISMGHREKSETEKDLRDLCSQTNRSKECWKIIKSELTRFNDNDYRSVAGVIIDLAIAKSDDIHEKLNQLYKDSRDDTLKDKYISCSKNYNDANRNLVVAKRNLDSDDYRYIPVQIDDAVQELKSCRRGFDRDSFDPAHIRNRNKEFGLYLDVVKVATDRLLKEKDRD